MLCNETFMTANKLSDVILKPEIKEQMKPLADPFIEVTHEP